MFRNNPITKTGKRKKGSHPILICAKTKQENVELYKIKNLSKDSGIKINYRSRKKNIRIYHYHQRETVFRSWKNYRNTQYRIK